MTSLTIRESSLLGRVEGEGSLAGRKALYFKRELAVKRKPDLVHSKVRQNTYSRTKKKKVSVKTVLKVETVQVTLSFLLIVLGSKRTHKQNYIDLK